MAENAWKKINSLRLPGTRGRRARRFDFREGRMATFPKNVLLKCTGLFSGISKKKKKKFPFRTVTITFRGTRSKRHNVVQRIVRIKVKYQQNCFLVTFFHVIYVFSIWRSWADRMRWRWTKLNDFPTWSSGPSLPRLSSVSKETEFVVVTFRKFGKKMTFTECVYYCAVERRPGSSRRVKECC